MLTEREKALMGPRDLKTPGSPAWCWQVIESLKSFWESKNITEGWFQNILKELREYRVWEVVPPEKPYGSLDALLKAEIGYSEDESRRIVAERAQNPGTIRREGRPTKEEQENLCDAKVLSKSIDSDYYIARIARDRPDILDRMKAGEYTSVRAAAIEAGIITPDFRCKCEPSFVATHILKRFTPEQIRTIITQLEERL